MQFGYTSATKGALSEDAQADALLAIGVAAERVAKEGVPAPASSKSQDLRPVRTGIVEMLRPGDQLCVTSARVLARNAADLFRVLASITEQQASVYVVDMDKDFTADPAHAELAEAFVGDSNKAQMEAARQKRKKHAGGRPEVKGLPKSLKKSDPTRMRFERMWKGGSDSQADMAAEFGCSKPTIIRRAADWGLGPKG